MRKVFVLAFLLISSPVFAIEGDKVAHFATSAAYGLAADTIVYHYAKHMGPIERTLASFGIAMVPGIAWEIKDEFERNNEFGWDDLAADAVGAITGTIAAELINGQLWISASGKQIRLVGKW